MGFTEAVRTVPSKYATFSGRASRSEYWWWALFMFLLLLVVGLLDGFMIAPLLGFPAFAPEAGQPLSVIVSLALFLPNLAVNIRRLHDRDRSGWWILIVFIPIIGMLVLLFWFVLPGTPGPNTHGEDPLGAV